MDIEKVKICEMCNKEYTPVSNHERQKFCSLICRRKKDDQNKKERGLNLGGYSRSFYLNTWLRAMGVDNFSCPCYWCGESLTPDGKWNIDHLIPRSVIVKNSKSIKEAKHKIRHDQSNVVVSCVQCNNLRGADDEETFRKRLEVNNS